MAFDDSALLAYMRSQRLGVVASVGPHGEPQAALVGIAVSPNCEVIFDTGVRGRKHANLLKDPRVAVVLQGPGEQTLQLQGTAHWLAPDDAGTDELRSVYFAVWPDGRERAASGKLAHWCVSPRWARYSDFDQGPLIREFRWPAVS
ncbi:pyridoxamine 5'-phosphate oxidase family protein [Dyella soli]|uniref:Pyridoxamine 5'-phosphate oxidase family protein n=2 Tax=Dyella TaxID=231454 RepID=A0A4R0YV85_9GAMM|nr:pyridoxamine 5'-phosphate oxidase family protein [Dyella soli]TBR39068.1 pyridoxamine 5'-phosphate oxidase family protein [Dyella terrae]TCI13343.1 pyridoxamine 5'-phosphate oxidase family protein [Dyella soli]